ncbi:MAG: hypothetical protein HQL73_02775 [Magnetococcales bacterium]|nr:hypothetical protein [Magnetococcales bacterium]
MTTQVQEITQAVYDLLKPVIPSGLFVMRIRFEDQSDFIPYTNIIVAKGDPPPHGTGTFSQVERTLELHFISTFMAPQAFAQAEARRELIHSALMKNVFLGGLCTTILEGTWISEMDHQDDGIGMIRILQQYFFRYLGARQTI